ncbi:MAG: Gfo/Idh/MocA family oxidoreductase, partial [Verrucomicrobia bacterium]|nr:Gfo/Idh/MocA family oxidoreductase [Verrucomicrobiota bacterium]
MIRIGVIGTGRAGLIHAQNYATSVPGARLAWLVDSDDSSRLNAAKELGLDANESTEADYREALKDDRLDAVVVATPTSFHRDIVVAAAQAGKHVLCEKPMALTADDCDAMIAACDTANVKLQVGFMRRFDAGFREAFSRLQAGEIGELVHARSLTHGPSIPKPWMFDIAESNGPLAEVNSHDIDTIRWFAGDEVAEVYAMAGNYRSPEAREAFPDFYDQIHLSMKFRRGAQGSISGAQGVRYAYDARAEIIGTEGILFVGG